MPKHNHDLIYDGEQDDNGVAGIPTNSDVAGFNRGTRNKVKMTDNGTSKTHNNMPPYYVLAYIMKCY